MHIKMNMQNLYVCKSIDKTLGWGLTLIWLKYAIFSIFRMIFIKTQNLIHNYGQVYKRIYGHFVPYLDILNVW